MLNPGVAALAVIGLFTVIAAPVDTLKSVNALPPHIAGRFEELAACQRSEAGDYFIFDRRAHAVFGMPASLSGTPRELVGVGADKGRVLRPSAFDLAPDRTFVIADAPFRAPRVQLFFETGARLGGFALARSEAPTITLYGVVVSGVGSVQYTGKSIFISQPDSGALVTEYAPDGRLIRTFGELRPTGQEADRDVHLALNTGRIVVNPLGGFYYVFLAGTPLFRKYDAAGKLLFERHIEGTELDEYVRTMPASWPKRAAANEIPLVMPAVRAAEADGAGNLWISLAVPFTYVYDAAGDKRRTVQFSAAGIVSPTSLFFGRDGRLIVTPGCYAFEP
jgi:hypothetical protein